MRLRQGGAHSTKWQGLTALLLPLAAQNWEAQRIRYGVCRFWQVKLVALRVSPFPLYMATSGVGTEGRRRLDALRRIAAHKAGGDDLNQGDAPLDPLFKGVDQVVAGIAACRPPVSEGCRADTASAVGHSRDHGEAIEILRGSQIALASRVPQDGLDALEIIDTALSRNRDVAPDA